MEHLNVESAQKNFKKRNILGKTSIKKKSKKGDIGHIRVWTYPPPLNSDIKNSDICSTFLDLPTH